MSGKKSRLKSLAAQREILLAESDLNRIHFLQEWSELKHQTHHLTEPVRKVRAVASSAAKIGVALSLLRLFRRRKSPGNHSGAAAFPVLANLLRGVRTGVALWQTFRR